MTHAWTALILAGQRPGPDPLARGFGLAWKALVPIAGEPMVTHVVRTLHGVDAIGRIIVLAQSESALADAIAAGGGAEIVVSGDGISTSIVAAISSAGIRWPLLITTADHPLLTGAMVEQFIAQTDGCDIAIAMVERANMMAHFPDARRTWLRLADGAWSGANLFALTGDAATAVLHLWAEAEADRKRPWRLFRHFGLVLALRAITRTIGLRNALMRAGARLGLSARLVAMADPVAAIDVDKSSDHAQAERILAARRALVPGEKSV